MPKPHVRPTPGVRHATHTPRRRHGLYPRQWCAGPDGVVGAPYKALKQARRHPGAAHRARRVKAEPRETLLPPDLFGRFVNDAFWCEPQRIPAGLRVV